MSTKSLIRRTELSLTELTVALSLLLLSLGACAPEDEELTLEEGVQLTFSQDTIQFDTVFTSVGSTTQWLQVHNPQNQAINISSIALGAPNDSPFRVWVNGDAGTQFQDVRLRGGDSLLVLVEVEIDPQDANLPFVIEDSIIFSTNGTAQTVSLEAWGQDAYFLSGEVISQNTTFTGERPYVVRDSLWVLPSATLTLAAGTQLYFDNQARLLIDGTLRAEGTPEDRVVLQYVRNDSDFADALGQWMGVLFRSTSQDNVLNYTTIRNAVSGVVAFIPDDDEIPDLTLASTVIENMAGYGILTTETDLDIYNTVISDCAQGALYGQGQAYYQLRHCTVVNDGIRFFREEGQPLIFFDQASRSFAGVEQDFTLLLLNSIVWDGLNDLRNELDFRLSEQIQLSLAGTLINFNNDTTLIDANLRREIPLFVDPTTNNYQLDSLSPAIDAGANLGIETDLNGNSRDARPDIGAYEFVGQ